MLINGKAIFMGYALNLEVRVMHCGVSRVLSMDVARSCYFATVHSLLQYAAELLGARYRLGTCLPHAEEGRARSGTQQAKGRQQDHILIFLVTDFDIALNTYTLSCLIYIYIYIMKNIQPKYPKLMYAHNAITMVIKYDKIINKT